jgi:signal peptidase II
MEETRKSTTARFVAWAFVALVVVIADQVTKWAIMVTKWAIIEWVALYEKIPLNSFINLTHQRNTGAAFSFLADAGGWQRWFFVTSRSGSGEYARKDRLSLQRVSRSCSAAPSAT